MMLDSGLPFYEALRLLLLKPDTRFMRLPHWKEDVEIHLQTPDKHSKMTHPYFYVVSRYGLVPWIPTQVEMLSTGWQIYTNLVEFAKDNVNNQAETPTKKPPLVIELPDGRRIETDMLNKLDD